MTVLRVHRNHSFDPSSHIQHAFQDVESSYLFSFPIPDTTTSHGLYSFLTIIPLSELGVDARETCHLAKVFMAYSQEGKCFAENILKI
jgi:hypothetical protein